MTEPYGPYQVDESRVVGAMRFAGVPIGTILPYIGELNRALLTPHWEFCDGRELNDPDSPLHGQRLPDLTGDRFLMGVAAAAEVGKPDGSNRILPDGNHQHGFSFTTSEGGGLGRSGGNDRYLSESSHRHQYSGNTGENGGHHHGGDKRPAHMGVYFIIRVK